MSEYLGNLQYSSARDLIMIFTAVVLASPAHVTKENLTLVVDIFYMPNELVILFLKQLKVYSICSIIATNINYNAENCLISNTFIWLCTCTIVPQEIAFLKHSV